MKEFVLGVIITSVVGAVAFIINKYWDEIITWFKRCTLHLFPAKFNVGLSFNYKDGEKTPDYFKNIKNTLLKLVNEEGLSNQLKIEDFSETMCFKNEKEAKTFLVKKKLDLIIWGDLSNDKLKRNGKSFSKLNIQWTCSLMNDKENRIGSALQRDINSNLAQKNYWDIIEDNSYEDTIVISNNILDVSVYIMARTFQLYGKLTSAIKFLETILKRNINDKKFKDQIAHHIHNCCSPIIIDYGIRGKNFNLGKEFCEKILHVMPNDFFALCNIAVFQYKIGEKSEAKEKVEKILKIYPEKGATQVNTAFFRILEGNYNNAFKHYEKLIKIYKNKPDFNAQYVIEFLELEYKRIKDPALLYSSGIISKYFGDEKIAKKDLKEFISKAKDIKYQKMFRNAKRIVNTTS